MLTLLQPFGRLAGLLALGAVAPCALVAQARSAAQETSTKPPPGMCRIWVDGVPAAKQPAPTDCATALKNKPANGRVLFGEAPSAVKPGATTLPMSRALSAPLPAATSGGATKPRRDSAGARDTSKRSGPRGARRDSMPPGPQTPDIR